MTCIFFGEKFEISKISRITIAKDLQKFRKNCKVEFRILSFHSPIIWPYFSFSTSEQTIFYNTFFYIIIRNKSQDLCDTSQNKKKRNPQILQESYCTNKILFFSSTILLKIFLIESSFCLSVYWIEILVITNMFFLKAFGKYFPSDSI